MTKFSLNSVYQSSSQQLFGNATLMVLYSGNSLRKFFFILAPKLQEILFIVLIIDNILSVYPVFGESL